MMNQFGSSVRTKLDVAAKVFGALLIISGAVLVTAPSLGASNGGCGTYSYSFTGTRLINDGISTSAGPFAIDLPAGTYDITMMSNENHPYPTYQTEQTQEQWVFVLDNGYVSPPTNDVPNELTDIVTRVGAVELAAAKSITVRHLGEGGVNSVNVECVGFTPTAVSVLPPATTVAVATTETPAILPPATTAEPAAVTTTTVAASVAPSSSIQAEVEGVVIEAPVQQLAVTGSETTVVALAGVLMIVAGLTLVWTTTRFSPR